MVGIGAAVVIAGSSPLWSGRVFADAHWLSVGLLSVGLAGFCLHATLLGMLAGTNRWTQYGALMVTDAVIRVAVAVATVRDRLGFGGVPVGHRRGRGGLADHDRGLADDPGRGPAADTGRHGDVSAWGGPFDHRGRCQRDFGDGLSGAAEGDLQPARRRRRGRHPGGHVDPRAAAGAADRDAGQSDRALRRRAQPSGCGR